MLFKINQVIANSSVLLLIIFALFLLNIKKKKELHHYLLLSFLFVNAIFLIGFLIRTNVGLVSLLWVTVFLLVHTFGLLFGPVLFFYSKSIIGNDFRLKKNDLLHLFPFTGALIVIILMAILSGNNLVLISRSHQFLYTFIINIHVLFYLVFTILLLKMHKTGIKNYYSNVKGIDHYWLTIVLTGFSAMWFIDFFYYIAWQVWDMPLIMNQLVGTLSLSINFTFAVLIFYEGLRHPEFFHQVEIKEGKPKNGKFKLSENEQMSYLSKIQSYMESEKPYLNQNLTINELSGQMDIPARFISNVINDSLERNFFDFVNYYRIEESKKYLSDPNFEKVTVLEILYLTGFNSKSTFNKVFKDQTGVTPTQFRNKYLKKSSELLEKIV